MRARRKGHDWEYRQYYDIRHAWSIADNIIWEQDKKN
jgi:hypothetical protein